jgi:hypothetical protein
MALVEQPVEIAATPPHEQHEVCVQRCASAAQSADRQAVDVAALEQRDSRLSQPCTLGEVHLPPGEPVSKCPKRPADPEVLHVPIMGGGPAQAVIDGTLDG